MRLEEDVHEQPLDRARVMADAVVAAGFAHGRMLQPVQRRLAGQWRAVAAPGRELAGEDRQDRAMAELVVVDHDLMPERDAEDTLANQGGDVMLDPLSHPRVAEAGGEAADQVDGAVRRAEQQRARVRGDRATVEPRHHAPALDGCKLEQRRATLPSASGKPPASR